MRNGKKGSIENVYRLFEEHIPVREPGKAINFWSPDEEELDAVPAGNLVESFSFAELGHGAVEIDVPEEPAAEAAANTKTDMRESILAQAQRQADKILAEAKKHAAEITREARNEGHRVGYEQGHREGTDAAYEEQQLLMKKTLAKALGEVKEAVAEIQGEKERLIEKHLDELRDLAIAVAEKIICVSLRTSSDIIESMIVSATERVKEQAWAKLYISQCDAELMARGDSGVFEALQHITSNVKIVVMDNAEQGDCIIEFPDQIIDAGVKTQLDNIEEIIQADYNG